MNKTIIIKKVDFNFIQNNKESWDELVQLSSADFIFSRYLFLKSFWETYNDKYKVTILLAIDSETKSWLGAFPLNSFKSGLTDFYSKFLTSSAEPYSDYFAPIIIKSYKDEIYPLFLENIFIDNDNHHIIKLSNIPADDKILPFLDSFLLKNKILYKKEASGCPVLLSKGLNKDQIFNIFKKNHRTDIRRQIKKLNELGDLSLKVFDNKNQIEKHSDIFFNMYKDRWEMAGLLNPMDKNRKKIFFENLINNFNSSLLHFSGLFLDDKPISYHIGFIYKKQFYYYKPTFDYLYNNYSPGKIHIWYLMISGCKEEWNSFDFGIGLEVYKKNWTNYINQTYSYIISDSNSFRFNWEIKWKKILKSKFGLYFRKIKLFSTNIKRSK